MKNEKPNAEHAWKQFEDLAPRLRMSTTDRVVYSHLFRHSRLEGKLRLRFSIPWLARGVGLSPKSVRWAVRRLVARGALRLVERSKESGHVVEVRLPEQVPFANPPRSNSQTPLVSHSLRLFRGSRLLQRRCPAPRYPLARTRPLFLLPEAANRP